MTGAPIAVGATTVSERRPLVAAVRSTWQARIATGALLLAVLLAADSLWHAFAQHHVLPFGDQWVLVNDHAKVQEGTFGIRDIIAQHNEHRIVVPRLLFLLDYSVFRAHGWFLLVCIGMVQLVHGLVLWRYAARLELSRSSRVLAAAVIAAAMFSAMQIENLNWAFQLQFVLVNLCVSLAVGAVLVARTAESPLRRSLSLGGAALAAVAAHWSSSNGILLWPILVMCAWSVGLPKRCMVLLAVVGTLSCGAWAMGYVVPARVTLPEMLRQSPHILAFMVLCLGNPIQLASPIGPMIVGAVGLASIFLVAFPALFQRRLQPTELALFHLMLFVAATVSVTAAGRVDLGLDQALTSRYVSSSLWFWACAQLILLSVARRSLSRRRSARALRVVAWVTPLAVLGALAAQQRGADAWYAERPRAQQLLADSLMVGVRDDLALASTAPIPPQWVLDQAKLLRQYRLSVFSGDEVGWMGQPLGSLFDFDPAAECPGGIHAFAAVGGDGYRVTGWLAQDAGAKDVRRVVLTDSSGSIVGLGSTGWPTPMAKVGNGSSSGWEGYAKVSAVPLEIRAYVVGRKGTGARRLRDTATLTRRLDRLLPWQPGMPKDAVAGVTLVEGTFQSNAVPHGIPETPGIQYVASWAGSDANVGRCAFGPFSCSREAAILVPFLTGPDSTNQSVRIVDAASGTSLAELVNPRIDHHCWVIWRVMLPKELTGRTLLMLAEDQGTDWGQWMAVGLPWWEK